MREKEKTESLSKKEERGARALAPKRASKCYLDMGKRGKKSSSHRGKRRDY